MGLLTWVLRHRIGSSVVTLEAYLRATKTTRSQFADRIGVSGETVRRYLAGTRIPTRENMAEIARETDGLVTANDFFRIAA
jgi:transcriptional regulator with XRE-family HTH domain